jgi:F0F1-type ATP synthase membrane subunit a
LFAPKGETTGLLKVLMVFVFIAVGLLEIVSILFRPVSLSFRLFGNIFAGENMLEAMSNLVPGWFGSIIIPFHFTLWSYWLVLCKPGFHALDSGIHHVDLPGRRSRKAHH